jgi:hypothetical protein
MFFYYYYIYIKESNHKGKNMKNTLAENLLRFGVKNLSESARTKLMEQPDGGQNPTVTVRRKAQTKRLTSSFKTPDGGTASFIADITLNVKTKKWEVGQIKFVTEGKLYGGISSILVKKGDGKGGGNFAPSADFKTQLDAKGLDGYSGPGFKPTTAANDLAAQLSKTTGGQWFASFANAFSAWRNDYYEFKKSKVESGMYQMKPGTEFGVAMQKDPETNQVITKYLFYGNYNNDRLKVQLDPNGTLSKNNASEFAKKIIREKPALLNNATDYWAKDELIKDLSKLPYQTL